MWGIFVLRHCACSEIISRSGGDGVMRSQLRNPYMTLSKRVLLLFCRLKVHAQGIHTVALACFCRAIIKYMPQVTSAAGTYDLCTHHTKGRIPDLFDPVAIAQLGIKARPAAMRIKFLGIVEQFVTAAGAGVDPFFEMHVVFARKGALGAFFP